MSPRSFRTVPCLRMRPGTALPRLLVVSVVVWLTLVAPGGAETPAEVIASADDNGGVYLAPRMGEFDEAQLMSVVSRTQRDGVRLLVVAPRVAEPDSEAFALRVRQAADIDAVLLFDAEGVAWASVSDEYEDGFVRAVEGARSAATPESATEAFVQELLNEPDRPLPDVIATIIRWTVYLLIALGLAALAEQLLRRRRRQEQIAQQELNEAR